MWVRGLKLYLVVTMPLISLSHPMWVRGLKHVKCNLRDSKSKSHPMWVRGLKLLAAAWSCAVARVAPHVGAWIETLPLSLPLSVLPRRTPCGCVD